MNNKHGRYVLKIYLHLHLFIFISYILKEMYINISIYKNDYKSYINI